MAVTLGNTSSGGNSSATSLTVAHTPAAGNNVVLFSTVYHRNRALTSIEHDGNAMTHVTSNTAYQGYIYLYYYVAPGSGAKNVVTTVSGGTSSMYTGSVDFSEVDQASPIDSSGNAANYASSISASATTVDSNTYIVGGGSIEDASLPLTATSGQTIFGETDIGSQSAGGAYELIATPASSAMSWSASSSKVLTTVVGAIAEAQPQNLTETISDSISLSDTVTSLHVRVLAIAESISLSDTVSYITSYVNTITESITLSDTIAVLTTFGHIISESLSLNDTTSIAIVVPVDVTESITLSDTNTVVLSFGTIIAETLNLNETVTTVRQAIVSVSESIALSDTVSVGLTYVVAVTETITMVEDWFKQGWSWMQKNTGGVWTFLDKNTP